MAGYEATTDDGNVQSAFRFSDALGKVDLGTLGGARSSGFSINNSGVVVGWSEDTTTTNWSRAFRAKPGLPMEDLGTLGSGVAGAQGINDAGAIVGWSGEFDTAAFLYTDDDGMIDLSTRIPPSTEWRRVVGAHGINNAGHIIVEYQADGRYGSYLLTPMQDTEPPVLAAVTADPDVLWPPNDQMVSMACRYSSLTISIPRRCAAS
jgi:probable HAF family extracellular repeat protein